MSFLPGLLADNEIGTTVESGALKTGTRKKSPETV